MSNEYHVEPSHLVTNEEPLARLTPDTMDVVWGCTAAVVNAVKAEALRSLARDLKTDGTRGHQDGKPEALGVLWAAKRANDLADELTRTSRPR